jgi:hypothetical protein
MFPSKMRNEIDEKINPSVGKENNGMCMK